MLGHETLEPSESSTQLLTLEIPPRQIDAQSPDHPNYKVPSNTPQKSPRNELLHERSTDVIIDFLGNGLLSEDKCTQVSINDDIRNKLIDAVIAYISVQGLDVDINYLIDLKEMPVTKAFKEIVSLDNFSFDSALNKLDEEINDLNEQSLKIERKLNRNKEIYITVGELALVHIKKVASNQDFSFDFIFKIIKETINGTSDVLNKLEDEQNELQMLQKDASYQIDCYLEEKAKLKASHLLIKTIRECAHRLNIDIASLISNEKIYFTSQRAPSRSPSPIELPPTLLNNYVGPFGESKAQVSVEEVEQLKSIALEDNVDKNAIVFTTNPSPSEEKVDENVTVSTTNRSLSPFHQFLRNSPSSLWGREGSPVSPAEIFDINDKEIETQLKIV